MGGGLQGCLSNAFVLHKDVWSICSILLIQIYMYIASFQCIKNAIQVYIFY